MAAADHGRPVPDLYQLLGVPREATDGEITQAWRRRALAEHPDRRPRDAAAPARFRALAEAYQVLGDPARRAVYDGSLGDQPGPGAAAPERPTVAEPPRWRHGSGVPVGPRLTGRTPAPPLWAGPVWVDVPPPASAAGSRAAEDDVARLTALADLAELAELAELAVRYLAGDWGRAW